MQDRRLTRSTSGDGHVGRAIPVSAPSGAAYLRGHFRRETFWTRSVFLPPRFRTGQWLIWQYHDCGGRDGVTGPVDLNVFRGSRSEFDAFVAGANA
jgi:lysozyme